MSSGPAWSQKLRDEIGKSVIGQNAAVERLLVALTEHSRVDAPVLTYLNRLSDALFVWSRWASHQQGTPETLWEPNQAASQLPPQALP